MLYMGYIQRNDKQELINTINYIFSDAELDIHKELHIEILDQINNFDYLSSYMFDFYITTKDDDDICRYIINFINNKYDIYYYSI